MMKLAKLEWMKLKRSGTMKVLLAVYAVVVPLIYWVLSIFQLPIGPPETGLTWSFPTSIFQFPETYNYVTFIGSYFNLMVGVIIIVFTTNEIKYKTQRQNVIDGLSKRDIILSKFMVVVALTALVSVYAFIVGLVSGLINGSTAGAFEGIEFVGLYFISTLGYFTFAFFFASVIRLPALAIVLYLVSTIVEGLVSWVIGLMTSSQFSQYTPLRSFADLVPIPLMPNGQDAPYLLEQGERTLLALAYIVILVVVSYWVIKRRDI